jgi:hypothetical protein
MTRATPDPATMEMPESASDISTNQGSDLTEASKQEEIVASKPNELPPSSSPNNTDNNPSEGDELSKDIQSKLRKFAKYEDKYPRMCFEVV